MRFWTLLWPLLALASCAQFTQETGDETLLRSHPERFVLITLNNPEVAAVPRAGSSPRDYGSALQYALAPNTRAAAHEIANDYRLKPVREWPISQLRIHCIVYRIEPGESQSDVLRRLRADARVESAQPLNSFATLGSEYNDPYAGLQSSLTTMGVKQAHAWSRGKGVTIAVIDTAVDIAHPDFAGSHIKIQQFTRQRESPAIHGTAVAGIIAATGGNGVGIVGVAPDAHVLALAACWPDTANPMRAVCDSFTLAGALSAAIELKADVVNLSLGGPADPLLRRLVEYGQARHMIFVAALPGQGAAKGFPSEIPGMIVVDSVGHEHSARDVLVAPGTDVLTLVPHDGYDFLSGSSMAAANLSGGIALLLSQHLKVNEIRDALSQTAPDGNSVNVCAALVGRQTGQTCTQARSGGRNPLEPSTPQRKGSDQRSGS